MLGRFHVLRTMEGSVWGLPRFRALRVWLPCGTGGTIGTMSQPKAMNLRFPDPAQRAAIESAARQAGLSLQEYILSAAYDRATAVEARFLEAFKTSMTRSGDAFAEGAGAVDPSEEQRASELAARRDLEGSKKRGHAA